MAASLDAAASAPAAVAAGVDAMISTPTHASSIIFGCAICLQHAQQPVVTPCGHVFCDKCLHRASMRKHACPLCLHPSGHSSNAMPVLGAVERTAPQPPLSPSPSLALKPSLVVSTLKKLKDAGCELCHGHLRLACGPCLAAAPSSVSCPPTKSVHCDHTFHFHCMQRWLLQDGGAIGCPLDDHPWVACPSVVWLHPFTVRVKLPFLDAHDYVLTLENIARTASLRSVVQRVCNIFLAYPAAQAHALGVDDVRIIYTGKEWTDLDRTTESVFGATTLHHTIHAVFRNKHPKNKKKSTKKQEQEQEQEPAHLDLYDEQHDHPSCANASANANANASAAANADANASGGAQ